MPTYAYLCDACGQPHEEWRSITAPDPESCPHCGEPFGARFLQDFSGANPIGWVYGNPTTVGQQGEINARRMGKERMQQLAEQAALKRPRRYTGKLPEGAKINTTGTGERPWFRDDGIPGLKPLDKPFDLKKVKDPQKYIATGETT